jgi:hypothetical protein
MLPKINFSLLDSTVPNHSCLAFQSFDNNTVENTQIDIQIRVCLQNINHSHKVTQMLETRYVMALTTVIKCYSNVRN